MAVATGGDGGDLSILKADLQAGGQGTSSSWKRFGMLRQVISFSAALWSVWLQMQLPQPSAG